VFDLTNKGAIIAGGTYGMGYSISETFAKQGAKVFVVGRNTDKIQEAISQINTTVGEGKAFGFSCDVLDYEKTMEMVNEASAAIGTIDALVCVVGGGFRKMFLEYTEQDWDDLIKLNLKSVFNCTQAVARQMVKQGSGGSIIYISSMVSWVPDITMSAYAAAKAAVSGLAVTLMQEFGPYNIRVNCVEPGFTDTPGARGLGPDFEKLKAKRSAVTALNRYGKPEDVAAAAVYLASDESSFMTGRSLKLDGGIGVKLPHYVED